MKLNHIIALLCIITQPIITQTHSLTKEQKKAIGMQLWKNESNQNYKKLVFWNPNESFPSLGIGHFIWYPANQNEAYRQTFPALLDYFIKKGITLPTWLKKAHSQGAPWQSRQDFVQHEDDPPTEELRKLLWETIDLQTDFIIERMYHAWLEIYKHASSKKRMIIKRHFKQLTQSPRGIYALIDYLNFKGDGTNINERYNGKGWGLLQVLEIMDADTKPESVVDEFVWATKTTLEQRVANAPAHKSHEQKWLAGWKNRIDTYLAFNTNSHSSKT